MLILAIESSAKPVSVALYEASGKKLLGQYFQNNGLSHSRTLLSLSESLMKNLDIRPVDLDLIAVSSGPGSFTGVRIGVSAAKGLAWGLDIPVCGVSTLEAMAYQVPQPGFLVCPVMDARRSQVYNAVFEWQDDTLVRLCDDRAIATDDLAADLQKYNKQVLLVGDGVFVCKESPLFSQCRIAPELQRYQTAYGVCLAAISKTHIPASELEPFYLRPSQAERMRNAK